MSVCVFSVLTPFSPIAAPSSVCAMSPLQAALLLVSGVACVTSSLPMTGYIDYYPGTTNTPLQSRHIMRIISSLNSLKAIIQLVRHCLCFVLAIKVNAPISYIGF